MPYPGSRWKVTISRSSGAIPSRTRRLLTHPAIDLCILAARWGAGLLWRKLTGRKQGFLATAHCTTIKFRPWPVLQVAVASQMPETNCDAVIEPLDSALFFSRPNRSLSNKGRWSWLALIAATIVLMTLAAAAIGAWMIAPFAGLELGLVWLAFDVIGRHDADYEVLTVNEQEFSWVYRYGKRIERLSGSRHWARFVRQDKDWGCELHLHYGGRCVELGQLMSCEQRERLSAQLGQFFSRISVSG